LSSALCGCGVPNGKHTSSLGEAVLLLHAADPLLQDGGDLGGGGLRIGGVGSDLLRGGEGRGAGLEGGRQYSVSAVELRAATAALPIPSTKLHCGANGIVLRVWERRAMAATAAGAMAGGRDGLTEAILLEAEIAATRRLDWRMALENMAVVLKRLLR
jgi:hypothetical protein